MDWEMTLRNEREKERIRRLEEQIALLEKGVH